jgi:hypothetical protein
MEIEMHSSPGRHQVFNNFIERWDSTIRRFCAIRNNVAHQHKYLENLGKDARDDMMREYIDLDNYKLSSQVEALEVVVQNPQDLERLKLIKFPTEGQKKERLLAILGRNFNFNNDNKFN